jgi:CheY-like chemotaxis protein
MTPPAPLILLVDDDPDFAAIHRRILETRGFRVRCAAHPAEAAHAIAAERPDAVVSDLMMDTLDAGFAFARKLKSDPATANIPVVIVTAAAERIGFNFAPKGPQDLAAMGADAWFAKPVPPAALADKLRELIAARPGGPP